ncbi:hypothetical protein ACQEVB_01700 [Pseudonocardia sp. CA-107938]|uniref:hypothetical protein n=1 Tax=Pseudonocardia sp. CA-107938 TaxID=3240021 RepID=UPI003D8E489D
MLRSSRRIASRRYRWLIAPGEIRLAAVDRGGEDVGIGAERDAELGAARLEQLPMRRQQRDRVLVDGDLACLVGLGALPLEAGLRLRVGVVDVEHVAVEVEVAPTQR